MITLFRDRLTSKLRPLLPNGQVTLAHTTIQFAGDSLQIRAENA